MLDFLIHPFNMWLAQFDEHDLIHLMWFLKSSTAALIIVLHLILWSDSIDWSNLIELIHIILYLEWFDLIWFLWSDLLSVLFQFSWFHSNHMIKRVIWMIWFNWIDLIYSSISLVSFFLFDFYFCSLFIWLTSSDLSHKTTWVIWLI